MHEVIWKFPPARRLSIPDANWLERFQIDAADFAFSRLTRVRSVGLDARAAFASVVGIAPFAADNTFWKRKCRRLLLFAPSEPILMSYFSTASSKFSSRAMLELASALTGRVQKFRTKPGFGISREQNIVFDKLIGERYFETILDEMNYPSDFHLGVLLYAKVILDHPFSDGNGKVARCLLHLHLCRAIAMDFPFLPLSTAFYLNASAIGQSLSALSAHHDTTMLFSVMEKALSDALALSRLALEA